MLDEEQHTERSASARPWTIFVQAASAIESGWFVWRPIEPGIAYALHVAVDGTVTRRLPSSTVLDIARLAPIG